MNGKLNIQFLPMNESSSPKPFQQPFNWTPPLSTILLPVKRACLSIPLSTAKKQKIEDANKLPTDLGKLIEEDTTVLRKLGWNQFVQLKRGRGDLGPLNFDSTKNMGSQLNFPHHLDPKLSSNPNSIAAHTNLATSISLFYKRSSWT